MDLVGDVSALVGYASPTLWLGALLIEFFAVKIRILPAVGYIPPSQGISDWLRSLVLPVTASLVGLIATLSKNTRQGYARCALERAHPDGAGERRAGVVGDLHIRDEDCLHEGLTILSLLMIGLLGVRFLPRPDSASPGSAAAPCRRGIP